MNNSNSLNTQLTSSKFFSWDFWNITDSKNLNHIFFLQAPRDDFNPEARHNVANVGHAVSNDLKHWEYRGTAIDRGAKGSWNDMAIWTGGVTQTAIGDYAMLVTGRSTRDAGRVQRIGVYFSSDLYSWREYDFNPVLECDAKILAPFHPIENNTTWRDPFVYYDKKDQLYRAIVTAQRFSNKNNGVGTITLGGANCGGIVGTLAVATSKNLVDWQVEGYLDLPEYFLLFECPQLIFFDDEVYLLFSADKRWIFCDTPEAVQQITGTHVLKAKSINYKFDYCGALLTGGIETEKGHLWGSYQLRVLQANADKSVKAVAWQGYNPTGNHFLGGITAVQEFNLK
jgi:sucrose-6-phosphate hydrolase SacC (GH32 family)